MTNSLLLSGRSLWAMFHGIVLGGGSLVVLAAALFALRSMRSMRSTQIAGLELPRQSRDLTRALAAAAGAMWLAIIVGTYVSFPQYRATPPDGITDLARYPRALILSDAGTSWLHSFAMEIKEHVPWIAAMLTTAVAFVAHRYRATLLSDARLNRMATVLISVAFLLAAVVGLLGILINKAAPLA